MSSTVFSVQNTHLQKIQPDILGFGISTFVDHIQFAENDVFIALLCLLLMPLSILETERVLTFTCKSII